MLIKKYRNRNGWVKLAYRRRYRLFGQKLYFVTSGGLGHTFIGREKLEDALEAFNIIKQLLEEKR